MQRTLKDLTETELKALAYDTLVDSERVQKNLKTINNEIAERAKLLPKDVATSPITATPEPEQVEATGTNEPKE